MQTTKLVPLSRILEKFKYCISLSLHSPFKKITRNHTGSVWIPGFTGIGWNTVVVDRLFLIVWFHDVQMDGIRSFLNPWILTDGCHNASIELIFHPSSLQLNKINTNSGFQSLDTPVSMVLQASKHNPNSRGNLNEG